MDPQAEAGFYVGRWFSTHNFSLLLFMWLAMTIGTAVTRRKPEKGDIVFPISLFLFGIYILWLKDNWNIELRHCVIFVTALGWSINTLLKRPLISLVPLGLFMVLLDQFAIDEAKWATFQSGE